MTLGIIGAMASETAALLAAMDSKTEDAVAGMVFHRGSIFGKDVVVVQCGIGKVCAAMCAQMLIDRYAVGGIVNTGIAGGLKSDMAVGDLVVADDAVQHDFDLTAFGHVRGYMPVIGGDDRFPSRFSTDKALTEAFRKAAGQVLGDELVCHRGTVVSGDVFVGDTEQKHRLIDTFGAVAAEMEGAAIAQVAYQNEVPFALVRAISDLADGGATQSYSEFEQEAASRSAAILLAMLADG